MPATAEICRSTKKENRQNPVRRLAFQKLDTVLQKSKDETNSGANRYWLLRKMQQVSFGKL